MLQQVNAEHMKNAPKPVAIKALIFDNETDYQNYISYYQSDEKRPFTNIMLDKVSEDQENISEEYAATFCWRRMIPLYDENMKILLENTNYKKGETVDFLMQDIANNYPWFSNGTNEDYRSFQRWSAVKN